MVDCNIKELRATVQCNVYGLELDHILITVPKPQVRQVTLLLCPVCKQSQLSMETSTVNMPWFIQLITMNKL